jgi:hypothetical protein
MDKKEILSKIKLLLGSEHLIDDIDDDVLGVDLVIYSGGKVFILNLKEA